MFDATSDRIAENVRRMSTRELLDRMTAYRRGIRGDAIVIMEHELEQRGVSRETVVAHGDAVEETALLDASGCAYRCRRCERPATVCCWNWHRLFGVLPIFPARFYYCPAHSPLERNGEEMDDAAALG